MKQKNFVLQYNGKSPKPSWMKGFKKGYYINYERCFVKNINHAWIFDNTEKWRDHFWDWEKEKDYFDIIEVKIIVQNRKKND